MRGRQRVQSRGTPQHGGPARAWAEEQGLHGDARRACVASMYACALRKHAANSGASPVAAIACTANVVSHSCEPL